MSFYPGRERHQLGEAGGWASAESDLLGQCLGFRFVLHHHPGGEGAGYHGAGAEPLIVRPAYPVLPERAVYALCGVCAHGTGEEPHPI